MKRKIIDLVSDKLTYWNGGFYSNKSDSRLMVPKSKPGIGWTLNFGNPKAVKLFILSIIIIVGMMITFILIYGL